MHNTRVKFDEDEQEEREVTVPNSADLAPQLSSSAAPAADFHTKTKSVQHNEAVLQ